MVIISLLDDYKNEFVRIRRAGINTVPSTLNMINYNPSSLRYEIFNLLN